MKYTNIRYALLTFSLYESISNTAGELLLLVDAAAELPILLRSAIWASRSLIRVLSEEEEVGKEVAK